MKDLIETPMEKQTDAVDQNHPRKDNRLKDDGKKMPLPPKKTPLTSMTPSLITSEHTMVTDQIRANNSEIFSVIKPTDLTQWDQDSEPDPTQEKKMELEEKN